MNGIILAEYVRNKHRNIRSNVCINTHLVRILSVISTDYAHKKLFRIRDNSFFLGVIGPYYAQITLENKKNLCVIGADFAHYAGSRALFRILHIGQQVGNMDCQQVTRFRSHMRNYLWSIRYLLSSGISLFYTQISHARQCSCFE